MEDYVQCLVKSKSNLERASPPPPQNNHYNKTSLRVKV